MRKIASRLIVLAIGVSVEMALLAASPASARIKVTISPASPIVDETITVKWKTDRALRPNYHYQVSVSVAPSRQTDCARVVDKDSQRFPGKGRSMRMNFSSTEDWSSRSAPEWCRGKAYARVSIVRDGGWFENIVGSTDFRFRRKP